MEAVKRYIDAKELMSILALPKQYINHKLEIIVKPIESPAIKEEDNENKMEILNSLLGCILDEGLSLEELRNERLSKYEITD